MRILIAEDDAVSRLILQRVVEQLGHDVQDAEDGKAAWALYQQHPVDVIISDWLMPEMDGLEFCRRVREQSHDAYAYFIFLTGVDDWDQMLTGIRAGGDDYLLKPLNTKELEVRLIVAERITRLHRELADRNNDLRGLNDRLFEQARKDALTGLSNRLRLREDLEEIARRVEHEGCRCCALMCDVDFFKRYNDHYGHQAGDEVLRSVAGTILDLSRGGDVAYRYGGEEFLVIIAGASSTDGVAVAERLRQRVEDQAITHEARDPAGVVTISIGVATLEPGSDQGVRDWLRQADEALYRAKQEGRNRVVVSRG